MSRYVISAQTPPIKAVLWDMDGLLADTEPLWTVAENIVCEAAGGRFTPELKATIVGTRLDTAVELIAADLRRQGCAEVSPGAIGDGLIEEMVQLYSGELSFMPGALSLVHAVREAGIAQALVSSSYRVLVDAVLRWLEPDTFSFVLGGDEVTHAKPHPEPYVTAAAAFGLQPEHCLVLEDSPSGMRSGLAAGCQALMVPSVYGVEIEPEWASVPSLLDVRV